MVRIQTRSLKKFMDVHWKNSIFGCFNTRKTKVCGRANTADTSQADTIMIRPRFLKSTLEGIQASLNFNNIFREVSSVTRSLSEHKLYVIFDRFQCTGFKNVDTNPWPPPPEAITSITPLRFHNEKSCFCTWSDLRTSEATPKAWKWQESDPDSNRQESWMIGRKRIL